VWRDRLNMIGCAAQFEREVMLERQRERIGGWQVPWKGSYSARQGH
jgi:hypothetical protein